MHNIEKRGSGIRFQPISPLNPSSHMKIHKAGFIAFPASDFEASMIFYRDHLELPVVKEGSDDFSRFAHFDINGFGIRIYQLKKPFHRAHTGLQLYVEDVDQIYQELKAKGVDFNGKGFFN